MLVELRSRRMCYNSQVESKREDLLSEIVMQQQTTNVLYRLLSESCRERDEAKEQLKKSMAEVFELKKLLNKLLPSSNIPPQTDPSHNVPSTAGGIGIRSKMSRTSFVEECTSIGKIIDTLIKEKPLPEKGRLLDAVVDTAPLLETLMITGQLPNWRNPPPLPFNLVGSEIPGFQTSNNMKCRGLNDCSFR
ncbi:hypothetical protein F3Y22_tig00002840pilonHSYRG00021 [Hibiscus syriacus]|uniref:Uncharacterized protein n=1 Tax=Hibiscus syriacus TaxID=106335 RepID=A0A6A3CNJ4_HIBSY|nr:uncharacterized protein LOC120154167 [Hibiscus syriacus]KAE8731045.1 hypothetical protein F3Y22_tig00002840pilonHSYRG00021 [Hibiscus syriacus]